MYLKKIKIFGFKSFADKTTLEFHEGITGVVGPNGCGKSNISDAFSWVLGATSAKALRGKKMEDIIFAGTTTRKHPANFAEVSLTLSNIEGLLPTEYEELEITRRYHRSGEAEFFLNKQPVRMKDIQDLFLDSGIGKSAFSIFEQGKIDQMIQFSPLERRSIFEEAAGILRFLQRKREALKKMEQTDTNISRIKDIHKEVEKQIEVLGKQAEEAKEFKTKKQDYENLEKSLFVMKWTHFFKKNEEILLLITEKKEKHLSSTTLLENVQTEYKEAKNHLLEGEKLLRIRSEEVYRARSEKEIRSREKQTNLERIKETDLKELKWRQELEDIILKSKTRKKELEQALVQEKNLQKEHFESKKEYESIKEKVKIIEKKFTELRVNQQQTQKEQIELLKKENDFKNEMQQTQIRLEGTIERISEIETKNKALTNKIEELTPLVVQKREDLKKLSELVDNLQKTLKSLEQEQEFISEEILVNQKSFDSIQREHSESEARYRALRRMQEENEGFSESSKRLLKESENKKSIFFGKIKGLYEYIKADKKREKAFSSILKSYSQTLVIEKIDDFMQVLTFAKKENLIDYSILCLESLKVAKHEKLDFQTESLVDKQTNNPLIDHFFKNIAIVDNFSAASTHFEQNSSPVWIRDGGFIDQKGVIFYLTTGEDNVFSRETELKELAIKLQELSLKKIELDETIENLHEKKSVIQSKRIEVDKNIRRNEMSLVESNFTLQKFSTDLEEIKNEKSKLDEDLIQLQKQESQYTLTIKKIEQEIKLLKDLIEKFNQNNEYLFKQITLYEEELEVEKNALAIKENHYLTTNDQLKKIEQEIKIFQIQEEESENQIVRMKHELESSSDLKHQFLEKCDEYETILKEVEESLSEVAQNCIELENEVDKRRVFIETIEKKITLEQQNSQKLELEINKLDIQSAHAKTALTAISEELHDRYKQSIEELTSQSLPTFSSLEQAEKQVKAIRKELEEAQGHVNMTSIDDFQKHKERHAFLDSEINDMSLSKKELLDIITELDSQSRTLFKETFNTVRANFQKNFKILFNGGEADLKFVEDGDVLEAGIEIIAKPPGKQMRSINLLSGGEKCMTAVALLFSIFEVKPAPFCILDEIDAPLDDANVERFVNLVKEFIDRCQFIIITHNKRTMAICDRLYGVSMQEKGVSKLLSIEFNKEKESVLVEC